MFLLSVPAARISLDASALGSSKGRRASVLIIPTGPGKKARFLQLRAGAVIFTWNGSLGRFRSNKESRLLAPAAKTDGDVKARDCGLTRSSFSGARR